MFTETIIRTYMSSSHADIAPLLRSRDAVQAEAERIAAAIDEMESDLPCYGHSYNEPKGAAAKVVEFPHTAARWRTLVSSLESWVGRLVEEMQTCSLETAEREAAAWRLLVLTVRTRRIADALAADQFFGNR